MPKLSQSTRKVPKVTVETGVESHYCLLLVKSCLIKNSLESTDRLVDSIAEGTLSESQCGFRKGRNTTHMVFTLRQLPEKCKEQHKPLYIVFIDLTKAFDSVNQEAMWTILTKLGCPPKFVNLVRHLHEGMNADVISDNEKSESFVVQTGIKQSCVLAPTLFALFPAEMLNEMNG